MSGNPFDLCDQFKEKTQQKQGRNDTEKSDDEYVAIFDKLLEDKDITKTQHKFILINFELISVFRLSEMFMVLKSIPKQE